MKYVYRTALFIAIVVTLLLGYGAMRGHPVNVDVALIVNGRALPRHEFQRRFRASAFYPNDIEGFTDHRIAEELMIEEAQKLGIDQEEAFRVSLQNFYEQSLVKSLMDRKYESLEISVTEEEIRRYQSLAGKTVRLSLRPVADHQHRGTAGRRDGVPQEAPFERLSGSLRLLVAGLVPGSETEPVRLGEERVIVRLHALLDSAPDQGGRGASRPVRDLLAADKRERAVDEWLWELRENAKVEIRPGNNAGGESG